MKSLESLVSLKAYAALHGAHPDQLRRALKRGSFKTAHKIGRHWVFNAAEPYPKEQGVRQYSRFTYTERLALEKMLKTKVSKEEIAAALGKTLSAVYRETKRGLCKQQLRNYLEPVYRYLADVAESKYREKVQSCGGQLKIGSDQEYADFLEELIGKKKFSPAAALAKARAKGFTTQISVNTLYNYIDRGLFLSLTRTLLPSGEKRRRNQKIKKAKRPPAGKSIEKRPQEVALRREFGHWEMDTVHGKADTKCTLLVFTERVSRFELVFKMPNSKTATVVEILDTLKRKYKNLFSLIFKSITVDNGSEFADSEGLQKAINGFLYSGTRIYYCHPYSSYERGSNENANKLIRRWIPKGTPIEDYTHKDITEIQDWMNDYPRKIFGWHTAKEVFDLHYEYAVRDTEYYYRI